MIWKPLKPRINIMGSTLADLVRLNQNTQEKYGPFACFRERAWKLREEFNELSDEIDMKDQNHAKIRDEALDVANVALTIAKLAQDKLEEEKKKW